MIEMEELAVVEGSLWRTFVEEGSAQELVFDFTGQTTGGFTGHLEFFIGVVVEACVLGYLVIRDSDSRGLENPIGLTSLISFKTQVLEVVHSLGVHELHELTSGPTVRVAELAL